MFSHCSKAVVENRPINDLASFCLSFFNFSLNPNISRKATYLLIFNPPSYFFASVSAINDNLAA